MVPTDKDGGSIPEEWKDKGQSIPRCGADSITRIHVTQVQPPRSVLDQSRHCPLEPLQSSHTGPSQEFRITLVQEPEPLAACLSPDQATQAC